MRFVHAALNWGFRPVWSTASRSPDRDWGLDVWARSQETVWKLSGNLMQSCEKNLRKQDFTVVPDFKSVGMKNHARCFEYMVIIRAINTIDAMTAAVEKIDWDVLERITDRILKEVDHVNRVCYDMSPKPPATIEFE